LQKKDVKEMSADSLIEKILQKVLIEENIVGERDSLQGKDILVASVILKYVKKIILLDKRTTPFTIVGIEESIESEMQLKSGKKISLGGVVDRIDQVKEGQIEIARIIDYKTGKIDTVADSKAALEDIEEYLRPYFLDGKYKAGFQAYYYASLFSEQYPGTAIKAGIFSTRSVNDGIKFLRKGKTIDPQILVRFNKKLQELAEEIMNPQIPFNQTEDISKCRVCAYKAICRR
jgi:ATP-dependent helicase/DNAse subunit B